MLLFEYTNISYDTDLLIRSKLFWMLWKILKKVWYLIRLSKALESVIRSD